MTKQRGPEAIVLADMREALLAEIGALATYRRLARRTGDESLRPLLLSFYRDELRQIARLRDVMRSLGGNPRRRSLRRYIAARLLSLSARLYGPRFALRVCMEAERSVSRWYARYAHVLARSGELEAARHCAQLSMQKRNHAIALQTWVDLIE